MNSLKKRDSLRLMLIKWDCAFWVFIGLVYLFLWNTAEAGGIYIDGSLGWNVGGNEVCNDEPVGYDRVGCDEPYGRLSVGVYQYWHVLWYAEVSHQSSVTDGKLSEPFTSGDRGGETLWIGIRKEFELW